MPPFCDKHNRYHEQVDYGRGKWGWECPACHEEYRAGVVALFQSTARTEEKSQG